MTVAKGKNLVLTQYPVVDSTRDMLNSQVGEDAEYLVVSTLVNNGYVQLLTQLRKLEFHTVYVLIADPTVVPLTSILRLLSFFIKAKSRFVVHPSGTMAKFGVSATIFDSLRLFQTAILGSVAMTRTLTQGGALLFKAKRKPINFRGSRDGEEVVYLRTNLWLGVQAGGALTHTWGVIGGFVSRGSRVRFFSADNRGGDALNSIDHVPVMPKHPYIIPREFNHFLYHWGFVKTSLAHLTGFGGCIYQRMSIGNFAGVVLARHLRVPLILEFNGSESWLASNWGTPFLFPRLVNLTEDISLKHADVVVTVSDSLRNQLIAKGVREDRICMHPNGVDPRLYGRENIGHDEAHRIRQKLGIPIDAVVVSFVGTFGPWHGAEQLAKAAVRLLKERENLNLYFVFIGDGVRRPEVETLAGDLIAEGRVIVTGLVEPLEIPKYLAASDILASPTVKNPDKSPFFGSPTKLFEYMAAGKAIVASDIGQISEVMADSPHIKDLLDGQLHPSSDKEQKFGVLVTPGRDVELSRAVKFLCEQTEIRETWGDAARKRAIERHTWDAHVDAIVEKLHHINESSKSRKVVVLINGLHSKSGGGVTYLRNMLPILRNDTRLDVHICLQPSQLPLFEGFIQGVTIHPVDVKKSLWHLLISEQILLPLIAYRMSADVTFSPANYGPLFAPRSVVLLRNALSVAFVERRLTKILYWIMLYLGTLSSVFMARNVISVSEYAWKSTVAGMFDWSSDKFHTIPHGISAYFGSDSSSKREECSLLFVSDIYVQKNLHGFFNSLSILKKQFPDIKLRVAGAPVDSDYDDRIRTLMRELQLGDVVEFLGNLDSAKLTHEYRRTTVFVFPSTVETFGNPLVEAMACGAPIACSNTAAMPEVAGEAAEYFDPYDAEDMARVVEKLLKDEGRREELSRLGIERAKKYSWEETARKTADVLIDAARN